MAVTQNNYTTTNATTTNFAFTFPYLVKSDVKIKINGTTQATTEYTWASATELQLNNPAPDNADVIVYRNTANDTKRGTFYAGSAIKAEDLNENFDQVLYVAQEVDNNAMSTLGDAAMQGDLEFAKGQGLVFEGDTVNEFQTSLKVTDPTADQTYKLPNNPAGTHTLISNSDTGSVTSTMITNDTIVDQDINSSAAITLTKLGAGALPTNITVASANLVNSTIATVDIADDAVTAAKIANNTITSNQIASGTILAANIDSNTITSNQIATGTITSAEIGNGQIINSTLASDAVNSSNIMDDAVQTAKIENDAVTTAKIADAELKVLAGMQGATASILADSTALAATNTEINGICDGMTKQATITDSDVHYPTSGAVVSYVESQLLPFGGFEVVADEDNFPSTQPVAGVVISISNAGGIVVQDGTGGTTAGRSTTARTVGNGSDNVTINNFPSSLQGTTLAENIGLMVSSTGSSQTYNYHKILGKEDDIKQLSDDINDFNERYRILDSAPSDVDTNHEGDLWYDKTNNVMKVWNSASSEWDDVASSSASYIVTLTEAFDGSRTNFTMSKEAIDAQSTLVSINGVIQKPNAGDSTPNEGFAVDGNTLKFSNAPATGSDYFVVVLGDTVSIGTPSDNTVDADILQSGCVTTAKIAADAVDGTKIADDAVGAEHIENLDGDVKWLDSKKAIFGTDGDDLQIYHDGSDSYVLDNGTGSLKVRGSVVDVSATNAANMILATEGGAVNLYHNGSKRLETGTNGTQLTGKGLGLGIAPSAFGTGVETITFKGDGNTKSGALTFKDGDDDADIAHIFCQNDSSYGLSIGTVGETGDFVRFFTGALGNERLRIDENGAITVGARDAIHATNDLAKFGIDCHGLNALASDANDVENYGLAFYNDPTTDHANGIGFFNDDATTCAGYIVHQDKGGSNIGDIVFGTASSANTPVERLRVTSSGIKVTGTINETGQEHDIWRLNSSLSASDSFITTNLERDDTQSFSIPGTGMTQSSGAFTFPSTGYWEVTFISTAWDTDAVKYAQVSIHQTNDNSNYVEVSKGLGNMHPDTGDDVVYVNVIAKQIVDVTNTTNVKVKFKVDSHATLNWNGSSTVNMTYMMFKRLGDT